MAAGVAFHERCDILYEEGVCVTREYLFNDTAQSYLAHVDVGKADDLATHNTTTLKEKDFTVKDRNYRIEDGDLARFAFGEERIEGMSREGHMCPSRREEDWHQQNECDYVRLAY